MNLKIKHDPTTNYVLKTQHKTNKNGAKMVMYRDSYMNAVLMHLSNHFSETTYVWDEIVQPQFRPNKGTDIFIFEVVEHQMPGVKQIAQEIKDEVKRSGIKLNFH